MYPLNMINKMNLSKYFYFIFINSSFCSEKIIKFEKLVILIDEF